MSVRLRDQQAIRSMLQTATTAHQTNTQARNNISFMDIGPELQDEGWDETHGLTASFANISMKDHEVQAEPSIHSDIRDDTDGSEILEVDIHGASFELPVVAGKAGHHDQDAGWTLPNDGTIIYDHILAHEDAGDVHYPWKDSVEWEVVQFLSRSGLSKASIDDFLKLRYVGHIFLYEAAGLTLEYDALGARAPILIPLCKQDV